MKRGVKEAVFCPVRALILHHITISLGKSDPSQWVGFEKGGRAGGETVACWVLLPRRLAVIQPGNSALKTKTTGDDRKVVSGHRRDGTRAGEQAGGFIRRTQKQSPAPHFVSPKQSLIGTPWVIFPNLDSCCLLHY